MDGLGSLDLLLFVAATFAAATVAGVAGFAFGLVAAAVWLHLLAPTTIAALIAGFGLIVQGVAVWKLRHALKPARLAPILIGAAVGVPAGVALLRGTSPANLRMGIGVLMILFSVYSLLRPKLAVTGGGKPADAAAGLLNGILGGATGLAGIIVTIWCNLRGWPRDEQRAVFQPVGVAVFLMTGLWLGAGGMIDRRTVELFTLGLPALLVGTWAGLRLYGRLDEAGFRKVVLGLLLVSGITLIVEGL